MPVDLQQKLHSILRRPPMLPDNVLLPRAFITKTVERCGPIPAGVDVLVEVDVNKNFALSWYDGAGDIPIRSTVSRDSGRVDVSGIEADRRRDLLREIPTEHLEAELAERRQKARDEKEGKK